MVHVFLTDGTARHLDADLFCVVGDELVIYRGEVEVERLPMQTVWKCLDTETLGHAEAIDSATGYSRRHGHVLTTEDLTLLAEQDHVNQMGKGQGRWTRSR